METIRAGLKTNTETLVVTVSFCVTLCGGKLLDTAGSHKTALTMQKNTKTQTETELYKISWTWQNLKNQFTSEGSRLNILK